MKNTFLIWNPLQALFIMNHIPLFLDPIFVCKDTHFLGYGIFFGIITMSAPVGQEAFDTLQQRVPPFESVFQPIGRVGRVLCDGYMRHASRRYMTVVLLLPARHKGQYRGKDNNCGSNVCSHEG